jgi:hypothetical protein
VLPCPAHLIHVQCYGSYVKFNPVADWVPDMR